MYHHPKKVELKQDKLSYDWIVYVDEEEMARYKDWSMADWVRQQIIGGG